MERESFFSGYCRQTDSSRMITVVAEDQELLEVDCCYPQCAYAGDCPVAQKITAFLQET